MSLNLKKDIISDFEKDRQEEHSRTMNQWVKQQSEKLGRSLSYIIQTFGCQQNENDSEIIAGHLQNCGYLPVVDYQQADLIIINTCSIRENADNHLFGHLGIIKNLKQKNPGLILAVCGCMVTQDVHIDKIKESYKHVDLLFGTQNLYQVPELLAQCVIKKNRPVICVKKTNVIAEDLPIQRQRKYRALVSIMYGCNNFCTFCIVPHTRGRERSRQPLIILNELQKLAAEGFTEIMLLGQNVNAYGKDLDQETTRGPKNFAELMEAAAKIKGLKRIRFMSSHPKDISDQLLEVIGENKNIEPHIHLALQSGSDNILKRMNRYYNSAEFIEIARKARIKRPELTITTDIMVGFPGESERDFQDTLDLMEKVKFDSAFTFIYSARPGTPAAKYGGQIDSKTVRARFDRLLELQNRHSLESNKKLENTVVEVLIEGSSHSDEQILSGRTADSRLINFTYEEEDLMDILPYADQGQIAQYLEGSFAQILIEEARTFSLKGKMISLNLTDSMFENEVKMVSGR